ncbi:hypothetical protein EMPG_09844 [Blastomyces silverae]|uniref:Uncharacterized protein n=1 Tax=Blastomyces silverae TaxID=2060906 RepID=A0A0H1BIQ4_9EURO|nr:hypothetical protein EMPG_09844 [Blastomyces silverae]
MEERGRERGALERNNGGKRLVLSKLLQRTKEIVLRSVRLLSLCVVGGPPLERLTPYRQQPLAGFQQIYRTAPKAYARGDR